MTKTKRNTTLIKAFTVVTAVLFLGQNILLARQNDNAMLAPKSPFEKAVPTWPLSITAHDAMIASEILKAMQGIPAGKDVVIFEPESLTGLPDELFSSHQIRNIYLVGPNVLKLDDHARDGARISRLVESGKVKLVPAEVSLMPGEFRQRMDQVIAQAESAEEAVIALRELYRKYDAIVDIRGTPAELKNVDAGLVISSQPLHEFYSYFHVGVKEAIIKKFPNQTRAKQFTDLFYSRIYQDRVDQLCLNVLREHALLLQQLCGPKGRIFFSSPLTTASLSYLKECRLSARDWAQGYERLARAWKYGHGSKDVPPFVVDFYRARLGEFSIPKIEWFLPMPVLNAKGSPLADYSNVLRTRVFCKEQPTGSGNVQLTQTLIWTPARDRTDLSFKDPGRILEGYVDEVPPVIDVSLAQTMHQLIPELEMLSKVSERWDLIFDTAREMHGITENNAVGRQLKALRATKDIGVIDRLVKRLVRDGSVLEEDETRLAILLTLDEERESPLRERMIGAPRRAAKAAMVFASREMATAARMTEEERVLQSLGEIVGAVAMTAQSDAQFQSALYEKLGQIREGLLAGAVDLDSIFVLDHCAIMKFTYAKEKQAVRVYLDSRQPFNVIGALNSVQLIAQAARPPSPSRIHTETERQGQATSEHAWSYDESKKICDAARVLEKTEGVGGVLAFKQLAEIMSRKDLFLLLNHLDKTRLWEQIQKSNDASARPILAEYKMLAQDMAMQELRLSQQKDFVRGVDGIAADLLSRDKHSIELIVWLGQLIADRRMGRRSSAAWTVRDIDEAVKTAPEPGVTQPVKPPVQEFEEISTVGIDKDIPENYDQAEAYVNKIHAAMMTQDAELIALRSESWSDVSWRTMLQNMDVRALITLGLAATAMAFYPYYLTKPLAALLGGLGVSLAYWVKRKASNNRNNINAREHMLDELSAREKQIPNMLKSKVLQYLPYDDSKKSVAILEMLTNKQLSFALSKMRETPRQDRIITLALATLPVESIVDVRLLGSIYEYYVSLKKIGMDVLMNEPSILGQKRFFETVYENARSRILHRPYYEDSVHLGTVEKVLKHNSALFMDREIRFQLMLEAIKAHFGKNLMLAMERGLSTAEEPYSLDKNIQHASMHRMDLVFKNEFSMEDASDFLRDLENCLGGIGSDKDSLCPVTFALHHEDGFDNGAAPDAIMPENRATLLANGTPMDQFAAALKHMVHQGTTNADAMIPQRLNALKGAASSAEEAVGYALLQWMMFEEFAQADAPHRLDELVLRAAFAEVLHATEGKALDDVLKISNASPIARSFSENIYRVTLATYKTNKKDPQDLDIVRRAYERQQGINVQDRDVHAMQQCIRKIADRLLEKASRASEENKLVMGSTGMLGKLFSTGDIKLISERQKLITAGTEPQNVYLVLSGKADAVAKKGSGEIFSRSVYKPGAIMSGSGICQGMNSDVDVIAATNMLVVEVNKQKFWDLAMQSPETMAELLTLLINRGIFKINYTIGLAQKGEDPGGALLKDMVTRSKEMERTLQGLGATSEQLERLEKNIGDAEQLEHLMWTKHMARVNVPTPEKKRSQFGTVIALIPELEKMRNLSDMIGLIVGKLKEEHQLPDSDMAVKALKSMLETDDETSHRIIIRQLFRAGVLTNEVGRIFLKADHALSYAHAMGDELNPQNVLVAL